MPKRTPEDILRDIEQSDGEEAADKALDMRADERRKVLRDAGVDVHALHVKADQWVERMQQGAKVDARRRAEAEAREHALRPPTNRSRIVLLVAALAIAAIVLALLLFPRLVTREPPSARPTPSAAPTESIGAPAPSAPPPPSPTALTPDASPRPLKPPIP